MGPPLSIWPYSHPVQRKYYSDESDKMCNNKCYVYRLVNNIHWLSLNFALVLFLIQVILCTNYVTAGPVILNMDYSQGPIPLARNIRHLPCISRRTNEEGLCMFAIDCLKANGTHLGTCIDRFYFGSCCQIPDKHAITQIISNNIDDNSIDNINFVHPHLEDKIPESNKVPVIHHTKKPTTTTERIVTTISDRTETVQDRTEPTELETKSDDLTTIDNKIDNNDDKLTTDSIVATTIKIENMITDAIITEAPMKLSTFQTVSGGTSNIVTEKPVFDKEDDDSKITTTSTTAKPKPTRKPIRPTYKPPQKPYSTTRPQITNKPKPVKPSNIYNTTRKPGYRPSTKRPATKKPLPSPPRLNITILPQSTSSKPVYARPSYVSITYINTTVPTTESTTTTTTAAPSSSITTEAVTDKVVELINPTTEAVTEIDKPTEKITVTEVTIETVATESVRETTTVQSIETTESTNQQTAVVTTTEAEFTETVASTSPVAIITTTEPAKIKPQTRPQEVTTKEPERVTTSDDKHPPGWVLISTLPPKPEPISIPTTTESTTSTTDAPKVETTILTTASTESSSTSTLSSTTDISSTTTASSTTESSTQTTEQKPVNEFVVNVTLSPTVPTSTSSIGLTTFSSVSSENVTELAVDKNVTEASKPMNDTSTLAPETTTLAVNMSDYKNVCGRRLWEAPTGRIVGGAKSGFGQWPWQISLRQYRTSTYLHKCGAALLNENWAITAAHCVEHVPPSELLVRLGEHDLAQSDEPYGFVERRVQIVASHPHFDPATFEYDLALLRFYEPVSFQPNILPVCVPDNDDDYVGQTAFVTGWGRLFDEGPLPSVLQEVQVPVINNTACEAMYQAAGYNEHIPNIFICAGKSQGGSDSCEGDSGGPMVIQRPRDKRFVLGGIISWGIGCAEPNQPGVYTRISEFRDWINQILLF